LTATTLTVAKGTTATVQYTVTNNSKKSHTIKLKAIAGVTQITSGAGICADPAVLAGNTSCTLSLRISGDDLTGDINGGPVTCQNGSTLQCYQPSAANVLRITKPAASALLPQATLTVDASPTSLPNGTTANLSTMGGSGSGAVTYAVASGGSNCSISGSTLTGTGVGTCTINATKAADATYSAITSSDITITVTSLVNLSSINTTSGPVCGGTGVILSGTGLTGTTSVTFGGVAATSVTVVNATTVTAVTPAVAAGTVDVVITAAAGSGTLSGGFTYDANAAGQSASGGVIACLNGGMNNLIAATADNSTGKVWGTFSFTTNATSTTDGSGNTTTTIGAESGANAAETCGSYEVDSQGNTPCEVGNTCYNDWFLPAGNNGTSSGQLNCLFTNRVTIGGFDTGGYWSSTEDDNMRGWQQNFTSGLETASLKNSTQRIRCVRAFTP